MILQDISTCTRFNEQVLDKFMIQVDKVLLIRTTFD